MWKRKNNLTRGGFITIKQRFENCTLSKQLCDCKKRSSLPESKINDVGLTVLGNVDVDVWHDAFLQIMPNERKKSARNDLEKRFS